MNDNGVRNELEKLDQLDSKLIDLLEKTGYILNSLASVKTPSDAKNLINSGPEEFSNLIQEIREGFMEAIEGAPKPGIPYYDPKPLEDLKKLYK